MNRFIVEADIKKLYEVIDFVKTNMDKMKQMLKSQNKVIMCVEEIFSNIAFYAYTSEMGKVEIKCGLDQESNQFYIVFIDQGVQYNPLLKKDPNINLSAEERKIGGLGIFISKKFVDEIFYEYKNNQNCLTLKINCYL